MPGLPQSEVHRALCYPQMNSPGPRARSGPASTPQSCAYCCDVTKQREHVIQGPLGAQVPTRYPLGPCATSTNRLGVFAKVPRTQGGSQPHSAQQRPSKTPLTRLGGPLGAHRGPKCRYARAPLHNAASVLPGLPKHTKRPNRRLSDTLVPRTTTMRTHSTTRFATATGLGCILLA